MSHASVLDRLTKQASTSHGYVTPETAKQCGVEPNRLPVLVARGRLERAGWGVYRVPTLPRLPLDRFARVLLEVGTPAAFSHTSAIDLHQLTDSGLPLHITVPIGRRLRRKFNDEIIFHFSNLDVSQVVQVDGISCTTLRDAQDACAQDGLVATRPPQVIQGRSLLSWANVIADHIFETTKATEVRLFGSVARGDEHADSDIDLLVIIPFEGRHIDITVAIQRQLKNYPVSVDVIAVRPEELTNKKSLSLMTTNAINNGRVLVSR
jgi:predicted nucleotidyltransferase